MTDTAKKRLPALTAFAVLIIAAVLALYFVSTSAASSEAASDSAADSSASTDANGQDNEESEEEEKAPIPVEATALHTGRVSSYISATANLVPENEVRVLAEWEGRVAAIAVEEGDRVGRGALLARLDPQDGEILREKARVRASTEHLAYQRAEKLRDQKLLSPEDFEKIALTTEIADQELAEAEWKLEKTLIHAPFGGRVTERMVQPGQHVRRGDELFTVADFDPLIARIYLPEQDVLQLEEGREVRISLRADAGISFRGAIRQISPVVDTGTGTVKVTIEARSAPVKVRPGAFVRIDVVRDSIDEAVLVPRNAVVRELQKAYVFVAKDGVAEKRTVTLGIEEDGYLQAVAGVAGGERVIIAGQGGLKDGSSIKLIGDAAGVMAAATPAS